MLARLYKYGALITGGIEVKATAACARVWCMSEIKQIAQSCTRREHQRWDNKVWTFPISEDNIPHRKTRNASVNEFQGLFSCRQPGIRAELQHPISQEPSKEAVRKTCFLGMFRGISRFIGTWNIQNLTSEQGNSQTRHAPTGIEGETCLAVGYSCW